MSFSFGSMYNDKTKMVTQEDALPGRDEPMMISGIHFVSGNSMVEPFTENLEISYFAMGCFWGAERVFWNLDGVFSTASGYQGGYTPNPTWAETCTAMTGHTETVKFGWSLRKNTISFTICERNIFDRTTQLNLWVKEMILVQNTGM